MNDQDVLAALTRWGEMGHAVSLWFGLTWREERCVRGWLCTVGAWTQGSITIGSGISADGCHPTSPIGAARIALHQAPDLYPATAHALREQDER